MKEVGIVALNTFIVYVFLAVAIRLFGRRGLGQLSSLDLLILILLGSSVETAMVHGSTLFRMGLVSATVLLITNRLLTYGVVHSRRFAKFANAGPVILVRNGTIVEENLKRNGLTRADLLEAMRERECGNVEDARLAVLEPDGTINVITMPKDSDAGGAEGRNPTA